jgi:DNA-binding CsgD family transcriptional regulator
MRYKDSINEVILIERENGLTYKEIAEKLDISIYKVKKVVHGNKETNTRRDRKGKANGKD